MADIIVTRADEVIAKLQTETVAAVLSIEHPHAKDLQNGRAPRLDEHGYGHIPQKILSFYDMETRVPNGPDIDQVREGLQFVMDHLAEGPVIIHCKAGRARSVGIALGVLALVYPDMNEKEIVDMMKDMRPIAAPNILVVEMIDQLTGRGGRLVQAVLDDPVMTEHRREIEEHRQQLIASRPDIAARLYPEKINKPPEGPAT